MTTRGTNTKRIADYALIGNCCSAALVANDGAIDWLCWPRFDSPAVFSALLDPDRGGQFRIRPASDTPAAVSREYLEGTAVLCTTFSTADGTLTLTDCMSITSDEDDRAALHPENEILRIVTCTHGRVEVEVTFDPRPNFGQRIPRLIDRGKLGIRMEAKDGLLTLRCDVPLLLSEGSGAFGSFMLRAGESAHFSLTHTVDAPAVIPPLGAWSRGVLARTISVWRDWSSKTRYQGTYRELVLRSAIVVRLLAFAPSGAIVAAPTTSLPETIGAKHNWDYRFCWLRDAAFAVRGMLELGHPDVAEAFTGWLLHATRLSQPKLLVLYDVYGRPPDAERVLSYVSGYAGSRPVRIGNGADHQVQHDSYGEVIDSVWRLACAGMKLDRETTSTVEAFGFYVSRHWRQPDAGIWEPRGEPKQHTHSLALCWVALDRLLDLERRGLLVTRHGAMFNREREQIRNELEERGFNSKLNSFTAELDGDTLDATSLLLGWYGYAEPSSERMRGTFQALLGQLSPAPGLLYRYRNEGDDEGAFGICSFWCAEHLARGGGTLAEATLAFEQTVAFGNDVGLFSEEIDPKSGALLGNFPQNFSHVGLLNAALSLCQRAERDAREAIGSAS